MSERREVTVEYPTWRDRPGYSQVSGEPGEPEPDLKVYRRGRKWEWELTIGGETSTKTAAKFEAEKIAQAVRAALCPEHERDPGVLPYQCRHCGAKLIVKVT